MRKVNFTRSLVLLLTTSCVVAAASAGCSDDPASSSSGGSSSSSSSSSSGGQSDGGKADSGVATFAVTANVVGLKGSGLVLRDKSGAEVSVPANGGASQKVTVIAKAPAGTSYEVTVKTQPSAPPQSCTVMGGTGTVVSGDVASITVNCADTYTIGGTVTGLDGKDLILQNGADTVTVNANGTFAFPKTYLSGTAYTVSVKQNPTANWQTCTISQGDAGAAGDGGVGGTIAMANVTNIAVNCSTNKYNVRLNVTGLTGSGLVFQNAGADNLAVPAAGMATFATQVASGVEYDVTVLTQPQTPWQTCTVTNPKAKMLGADVTLAVACTVNKYKISGMVTGLQGNGLVIQNNAAGDITRNGAGGNGAFSFAATVDSGMPYAVTVKTQPSGVAGERCSVVNGSGTVAGADVTNVEVKCSTLPDTCKIVNGVTWCYNPAACGEPCNAVCASLGRPFNITNEDWFAAQDTAPKCQAINDAFGLGGVVSVASYTYACSEDQAGNHSAPGGLIGPLLCSNFSGCPQQHRTNMDQNGVACGANSRRSLCPCQ